MIFGRIREYMPRPTANSSTNSLNSEATFCMQDMLTIDGLDEQWMQGVPSPWEGQLGQFDAEDLERIPEHIRNRL
jgi:hypothetical protein